MGHGGIVDVTYRPVPRHPRMTTYDSKEDDTPTRSSESTLVNGRLYVYLGGPQVGGRIPTPVPFRKTPKENHSLIIYKAYNYGSIYGSCTFLERLRFTIIL